MQVHHRQVTLLKVGQCVWFGKGTVVLSRVGVVLWWVRAVPYHVVLCCVWRLDSEEAMHYSEYSSVNRQSQSKPGALHVGGFLALPYISLAYQRMDSYTLTVAGVDTHSTLILHMYILLCIVIIP